LKRRLNVVLLTPSDIQKFGLQLIQFDKRFVLKLKDLWLLHYDVFLQIREDMEPYDIQGTIHELVERINETDNLANNDT
jgi:hypothetical protein